MPEVGHGRVRRRLHLQFKPQEDVRGASCDIPILGLIRNQHTIFYIESEHGRLLLVERSELVARCFML